MHQNLFLLIFSLFFIASCEEKRDMEIVLTGSLVVNGHRSSELKFLKVSSVLGNDYIESSNREILKFSPDFPLCNFFLSTNTAGNTYAAIVYQKDGNNVITYSLKNPQYIYQKNSKVFQIKNTTLYKEINWKTHEVDPAISVTISGSLEVNQ